MWLMAFSDRFVLIAIKKKSMWDNYGLNAELLDLKLWGEGCSQYQIRQTGDDEFCLIQSGSLWQVVYAAKGSVQEVLFESPSEEKLRSLEQQHGIYLPAAYRTFILEVGNGGKWERLEYYWTIQEVMANNSAEFWNQPLPEFITSLKESGSRVLIEVIGHEFDHFSGLLRISDWSCRGRSHFLTAAGDEVDMQENTKTTMLVILYPYNHQQWLQMFLDDIQYGLEQIERFLTFIRSGRGIAEIKEYHAYYCTPIAKLLAGTLQLDIDPNLDNAELMSMRSKIDYKIEQWRIKNMGKILNNFGFKAEQAEIRSQRVLSKLGYLVPDS